MAMSSALLLAHENEKLHTENQRQKRKRAKRRIYVAKGGVLTGAEGLSRAQTAQNEREKATADAAPEQLQRAVRKCSMCRSTEHTARTCPTR
jgi:hypothetical protein